MENPYNDHDNTTFQMFVWIYSIGRAHADIKECIEKLKFLENESIDSDLQKHRFAILEVYRALKRMEVLFVP